MCLDRIDEKPKKWVEGWKVFDRRNGKLYPACMPTALPGHKEYPVNEWIRDTRMNPKTIKSGSFIATAFNIKLYPTGFHFFKTKTGASVWGSLSTFTVRKIKVKNVVATGTQDGCSVGVAKKIYIIDK